MVRLYDTPGEGLMAIAPGQGIITGHAGFEIHHVFDFSGSMAYGSSGQVEIDIKPGPGQILFWSSNDAQPGYWILDADGSNVRNISNIEWDEYDPIWIK